MICLPHDEVTVLPITNKGVATTADEEVTVLPIIKKGVATTATAGKDTSLPASTPLCVIRDQFHR